jgi:hypothetical protein
MLPYPKPRFSFSFEFLFVFGSFWRILAKCFEAIRSKGCFVEYDIRKTISAGFDPIDLEIPPRAATTRANDVTDSVKRSFRRFQN